MSLSRSCWHSKSNFRVMQFVLIAVCTVLPRQHSVEASSGLSGGFKTIGYVTSWAGDIKTIPYSKLTHICYAFMTHKANGSISIPNLTRLQELIASAHRNGVKVLISVGGWNKRTTDSAFESLSASLASRSKFIDNVVNAIKQNDLDGIDIDWEYPLPGSSTKFTALIQGLRVEIDKSFGPGNKLISVAVASDDQGSWYAQGISPDIYPLVDWLTIMAYDGPAVLHANYDWSTDCFRFWTGIKKLPASKAVLGVPFYSRPHELSYRDIVAADPANAQIDCYAGSCYNGIPTIRRKAQYVLATGGAGMSFWELTQDSSGPFSLVDAVYREVRAFEARKE